MHRIITHFVNIWPWTCVIMFLWFFLFVFLIKLLYVYMLCVYNQIMIIITKRVPKTWKLFQMNPFLSHANLSFLAVEMDHNFNKYCLSLCFIQLDGCPESVHWVSRRSKSSQYFVAWICIPSRNPYKVRVNKLPVHFLLHIFLVGKLTQKTGHVYHIGPNETLSSLN